jgi:hypothetical protein
MELTSVAFAPMNLTGTSAATFTIMVWQGGSWSGTTGNPGALMTSQTVTHTWGTWNEYTLDTPVEIDATKELWIGYKMVATAGYPAGNDAVKAIFPTKSAICNDLFNGTGWCLTSSLNPELNKSWRIRGKLVGEGLTINIANYDIYQDDVFFDEVDGEATSFTADVTGNHNYCIVAVYENDAQSPKVCKEIECGDIPPCDHVLAASATIAECATATIVWTNIEGAKEYRISREGVDDATVAASPYIETAEFEEGKTYKWTIVTVCEENESEGVEVTATAECEVGINELSNSVAIYPNPSSSMVTIIANNFAKVEVYNTVGQLVETRTVNTVDVSSYNTGIYFFKVYDSANNSVTKRVMVTK